MHPPSVETADLERNEGILATAMHCVNAIPYVVEADAGHPHLSSTSRSCRGEPVL